MKELGRVEHSGGMQASLAGRYARALFDLAQEQSALPAVESSMDRLGQALATSAALQSLFTSPVISRADAARAAAAAGAELGLDPLTRNFVGVLAKNRRLGQVGAIVRAFAGMTAAHRGETSAEITSAHPLTDDQMEALKARLKNRLGRDVAVNCHVDPAILGGLVVKVGSRLIDSSIRTRLNTLAAAMKG